MATTTTAETAWSAGELYRRLEGEDPFFVLDVRAEDDYEAWKIEGRGRVPTLNVPYYEMLDAGEHDDVTDTFEQFLSQGTADELPREKPILAVCAKGDTADHVAQALRRLGFDALNLAGGLTAWGDHYHVETVVEEGDLEVLQVSRPARGCLSYVVVRGGAAVLIDPLRHTDRYLDLGRERGFEIARILETHAHADHISGGPALAEATGAPYHLHPYDGIHPVDVLPATLPYEYLRDGDVFEIGGSRIETIHIPGHTLGNVAYLLDGRHLFTGDSIFLDSIARPDLGGRGETWAPLHHRSLRRLLELPDETTVLPAHFSSLREGGESGLFRATLGELKRGNEGLVMAAREEDEFVDYILASLPRFPPEYVEIKRVNAGLKQAGEALASELELGKNVCALAQAYEEEA